MAFLRTCCCCCDLRTGVLLIGILTLIMSGYTIVTEAISLRNLQEATDYFRTHPDDTAKYGFSADLLDIVLTMAKVGIGMTSVTALSAIMLLIPACFTQRESARPFRGLLFGYVSWQVIGILFSIGYGGWVLSKFTNPVVAAALIAGFGISIPLGIYFVLVVIAFFIELGEEPGLVGGIVIQQPKAPYGNFQNEPPPQYQQPGYPPYQQPEPYTQKQGIV